MIHSNIPKNSVTICVDPFNVILFFCAIVILCVVSCSWLWISLALFCEGGNNRPFEFKFELSRILNSNAEHNTLSTHNAERSPRNKRSHVTYELRCEHFTQPTQLNAHRLHTPRITPTQRTRRMVIYHTIPYATHTTHLHAYVHTCACTPNAARKTSSL